MVLGTAIIPVLPIRRPPTTFRREGLASVRQNLPLDLTLLRFTQQTSTLIAPPVLPFLVPPCLQWLSLTSATSWTYRFLLTRFASWLGVLRGLAAATTLTIFPLSATLEINRIRPFSAVTIFLLCHTPVTLASPRTSTPVQRIRLSLQVQILAL